nr:hypothetical protein [Eubacterium sp.]
GVKEGSEELDRYYSAKYIDLFRENLIQEINERENIEPEYIGTVGYDKIRRGSGGIYKETEHIIENAVLDFYPNDMGYRKYMFDKLQIRQAVIKYDDDYILCGQCKAKGCRRCSNDDTGYIVMGDCEDKIVKQRVRYTENEYFNMADYTKPYKVRLDLIKQDKNLFNEDTIETYAWIPIKKVSSTYEITSISSKDIRTLMGHILGEV